MSEGQLLFWTVLLKCVLGTILAKYKREILRCSTRKNVNWWHKCQATKDPCHSSPNFKVSLGLCSCHAGWSWCPVVPGEVSWWNLMVLVDI